MDKTKAVIRLFAVTSGTQVTIQKASDAETWTNVTTLSPPVNQFYYFDYNVDTDYLRIVSTNDLQVSVVFE
ncbi:hypothetical protein [Priestia megaterium]|uniref:hypothetical protein n=1 Tax=Priestia megaterium TaxID=1404 RepID=UPI00285B3A4A|nr:hypothetical protein [Priestia megaterium]MDR7207600.1 hypothetical protein [Priestia megaterium]